jgi:hypothetical protein
MYRAGQGLGACETTGGFPGCLPHLQGPRRLAAIRQRRHGIIVQSVAPAPVHAPHAHAIAPGGDLAPQGPRRYARSMAGRSISFRITRRRLPPQPWSPARPRGGLAAPASRCPAASAPAAARSIGMRARGARERPAASASGSSGRASRYEIRQSAAAGSAQRARLLSA